MSFKVPRPAYETTISDTFDAGATSFSVDTTLDGYGDDLDTLVLQFTLDKGLSTEEHIIGTVDTATSKITSVSYLNVATGEIAGAGTQYGHRKGSGTIEITSFPYLTHAIRALTGAKQLDSTLTPMAYDGDPGLTPGSDELCTVDYADNLAIAGSPNATESQKGIVEQATAAEGQAGTDTGATGASLFAVPSEIAANTQNQQHMFAADSGAADAYAITLAPAPGAYASGQKFCFLATNLNTGASTLDVNGLGAKNILKANDQALEAGDIEAGQIVEVVYNGTEFEMQTPVGSHLTTAIATETTNFFSATDISGSEAETLTDGSVADTLHSHSTPAFMMTANDGAGGAANGARQVSMAKDGRDFYVSTPDGASHINIEQFKKDTETGLFYFFNSAQMTFSNNVNSAGLAVGDTYIYGADLKAGGADIEIQRMDRDLTGEITMTIAGTANTNIGARVAGDDTNIYYWTDTSTNMDTYTVSGTTATRGASFAMPMAENTIWAFDFDGTDLLTVKDDDFGAGTPPGQEIERIDTAGVSQGTVERGFYNPDGSTTADEEGISVGFAYRNDTTIYLVGEFDVVDPAAITGSEFRLFAVTKP